MRVIGSMQNVTPSEHILAACLPRRCWSRLLRRRAEIHFRSFACSFGSFEVGVVASESRKARDDVVWEQADVGVVVLQGLVVATAFDGYPVFCARQLVLQAQEIFIRLQLR